MTGSMEEIRKKETKDEAWGLDEWKLTALGPNVAEELGAK